jgi:putative intracellular protease/amidase
MRKHVLIVLTSRRTLDDPARTPTGAWLEEFAAAYYRLLDAGHRISLATPAGGDAPLDPASFVEPWITEDGHRLTKDDALRAALAATLPLVNVDADSFDAVYFVGGAGVMWDFPDNRDVARLLAGFDRAGKPIGAVCHGVACLLNQVDGRAFAANRKLTVISDREDELAGYDKLVPYMPEGRLRDAGAELVLAEPFAANAIRDRNLVTGQNPASAAPVATMLLDLLAGRAAA